MAPGAGLFRANHTARNCRTASCWGLEPRQHDRGLHFGTPKFDVSLDHMNLACVAEKTGYWSHQAEGLDSAGAKVEATVGVRGQPT